MPQDLPFDIQRRVDEAKRRQTERQTEDTQRKRLRKKELLFSLQHKLRRQFSAFGSEDVDRELKRVRRRRRDRHSFGNITLGDKTLRLGPLAEGLLPPKPANERTSSSSTGRPSPKG